MTVGTFFDGTNDWISSNTGTDITADNITCAAMVYVAATDASRYIATWRVSGTGSALRIGNGGAWIWYDGSSSAVGPSATDDAWALVIVSKAAGTTTPRFHIYNGTSWSHTDAGSSNGNMSGALTEIRLGADIDGSAPFSGELATVGLWNETTDDSTAETYLSYTTLAAKSNARFFTGESLISGGTMNDTGSGNNDETSRQGATTGSQTVPSWFTNFGSSVNVNAGNAAVTATANAPTITRTDPYVVANAGADVATVDDASVTFAGTYVPLENDVIVFFISSTTTMGIVVDGSLPSGWVNPLGSGVEINSDGHGMGAVYHKVTSAEQTAVTLTYTATNVLDAAELGYVQAVAVRNVDPTTPIDGSGTAFDSANTVTPHVLAGITGSGVLIDGSLVVSSVAKDATGAYSSTPAGWTQVRADNTNNGRWVGYRNTHTVVDTNVAATNITPSAGDEYVSITLALNRASNAVNASAGNAPVTATANNPSHSIALGSGSAAPTVTANNPSHSITATPSSAAVTTTANNPSHTNSTGPSSAAVSATANNPSHSITATPTSAAVTFTANNATTTSATVATAGNAPVTVTANDPSHTNTTGPTSAAVTVTGNDASHSITATPTSAAVTATANNPTISTSVSVSVDAGNAAITITANDPSHTNTTGPTSSPVTFTANNPTISVSADVSVNAGNATVTVTANDASHSITATPTSAGVTATANNADPQPTVVASAGNAPVSTTANNPSHTNSTGPTSAAVTVTANNPSITTSSSTNVNAESAAVTVTANQPTVTRAISAQAGVASVTVAANNAAVAVAVMAMVALVTVTANDASTIDASIGATTLGPLVVYRRPGVVRLGRNATVDRTRPGV